MTKTLLSKSSLADSPTGLGVLVQGLPAYSFSSYLRGSSTTCLTIRHPQLSEVNSSLTFLLSLLQLSSSWFPKAYHWQSPWHSLLRPLACSKRTTLSGCSAPAKP